MKPFFPLLIEMFDSDPEGLFEEGVGSGPRGCFGWGGAAGVNMTDGITRKPSLRSRRA